MFQGLTVKAVIPARNEQASIERVLDAIPQWVDRVIVVNNGSTDCTADIARRHGAIVVDEPRPGYGQACLAGITAAACCDVIVFLDGDFSDYPDQMDRLVKPIAAEAIDMVIGSRTLGKQKRGALTPQARFGNALACRLIRRFWQVTFTDLGPFRAIRTSALASLGMSDTTYGWTVEMQVKAVRKELALREVPVDYRRRIGRSKISGTLKGVIGAGTKILGTILVSALTDRLNRRSKETLVVFTRYPQPGTTKTRMIPALDPVGAADLQREMTAQTMLTARCLTRKRRCRTEVRYGGGEQTLMADWLGSNLDYRAQGPGNLGQRMARAFADQFHRGTQRMVIIGTDCPDLTSSHLREAFVALTRYDVVLGPAVDGGYYLIGIRSSAARKAVPTLFADVPWGTSDVLRHTLARVKSAGLSYVTLPTLADVDRPDDLNLWKARHRDRSRISVIVPTLNEAESLQATLQRVRTCPDIDLIVVDAGSSDHTVDIARSFDARVLHCARGRGAQMNLAVSVATGNILLFLHADTLLPRHYDLYIRETLSQETVSAGAFELSIDAPSEPLRLIEHLANFRSRRMHLPYGDQAIFVRRSSFWKLRGFGDIPIMEDYDFVRRIRRSGEIALVPLPVRTSPRRWLDSGIVKTTLVNQLIIAGYELGLSPQTLARLYRERT